MLSSLWLRPGVILGEGLWTRLDCEAVAHEFVVSLRCGRYAPALGQNWSEFLALKGRGLWEESLSEGQSRAAGSNLVYAAGSLPVYYGDHLRSLVGRATEILTFFPFEPLHASTRRMHHHDRTRKDRRRVVKT